MRRLAGSDAGFLFIETPNQTSVCVDLAELAPSTAGTPPLTLARLRSQVAERLPLLPSWRWRLEDVPLGINHPVFIEDPDFDLDYHLREHTLPAPGGQRQVEAFVAEVLPQLLDLRHPLWRVTLVHGLAEGRQALLFQFHHALADGAAILFTLDQLLGPAPDPLPAGEPPPGECPRQARLLRHALSDQARSWRPVPSMIRETKARFAAVEARRAAGHPSVPKAMGDAPDSIFNRKGPPQRTTARTTFALADLERIRPASGASLNDVALAIVGGGLRRYLLRRGEPPEGSLVANCPVSGDPPGTPPRQWGNRFANILTYLGTDVAEPCLRLERVTAGAAEAKAQLQAQGHFTIADWLDRIPPLVGRPAARRLIDSKVAHPERSDYNVLVSNVRVQADNLAIDGWRLDHLYLSGPTADDAGLNVTVVGFRGTLHLTVVANPVCVPDAAELVEDLRSAYEELAACTA